VCAAVAALGIAGIGSAQAQSGFKVTGGGQGLATADSSSVKGPGDTYGFNAQDTDGDEGDAAKGQFNSIQRDAAPTVGHGKGQHIKGAVTCLVATETPDGTQGAARFGGVIRGSEFEDTNDEGDTYTDRLIFIVDVTDNGEGNADDDFIHYEAQEEDADNDGNPENDPGPCDPERELGENEETILARGNVQVHNYTAPE
jgi:hypothetical protein